MFYGTAAAFATYHTERGNTLPAILIDDDAIEIRLLKASEWIDARYKSKFKGLKVDGRSQIREWPRSGHTDFYGYAIPSDETPREIEYATYEAALIDANAPGVLNVDYTPSKYTKVSVDGAVAAEFALYGSASEVQTQYSKIAEILGGLLNEVENVGGKNYGSSNRT